MITNFIIGTGRCGTTMLAQMLNTHSEVCIPHEIQILFEYSNNGKRLYETFEDKQNLQFKSEDFITLISERCPHNFHNYFNYKNYLESLTYPIISLNSFINKFYFEIAKSRNKKIFFEQTPWYGQRVDILNDLFPNAKYIHMIRDGRDVAISFAKTPWWHNDIELNLARWHYEINAIIDSCKKTLNPEQVLQVRYEDLVKNPEIWLREICYFLSIDFEMNMLKPELYTDYTQYNKNYNPNISSDSLNNWRKTKTHPTFSGSIAAWKKYPHYNFSCIPEHIKQNLLTLGYSV